MICSKFEECIEQYKCIDKSCLVCRSENSAHNITSKENGRRYNLINDKRLRVVNYLIDGGVYREENDKTKCDRLYVVFDQPRLTVIFVELKGKSIKHALEQLKDTAVRHKSMLSEKRTAFRVVCSGAPKIGNDPQIINLKKCIFREFNTFPIIKENNLDEAYSTIK
ncbi:MAG: hypothetical protein J6O00_03570 [Clostridiales bacterium]|nr:hypothetical protein [Clostridiales bacterium]